ncbi:MAG: glycerophosphodiester phosphodiesterase [Chloroflexi bacterium]|nr:MAG: glycerophosphodiester phosphodiesterase [Chloroflexota bacterium]
MVTNIAHGGARSLAPENTLAAARKALEIGADLWETDVAVTADEQLILFHDDSMARTTNAAAVFPARRPWIFTTMTFDEVRALDAGSWFVETDPFGQIAAGAVSAAQQQSYRGEKVPTLAEALIFTQEANFTINIELKRLPPPLEKFPVPDRVLDLVDALKIDHHRLIFSSANQQWLRVVKKRHPDLIVQAVLGIPETAPLEWGNYEFDAYNVRHTMIDEATIRNLHQRGVNINLWTVNHEEDMRRFIAAGAAGLITDFPQRLKKVLEDYQHE